MYLPAKQPFMTIIEAAIKRQLIVFLMKVKNKPFQNAP